MINDTLTALLAPLLDQLGLELERLEVVPAGRRRVVRVTVDGDGDDGHGPTLDDIAEATSEISRALDDADAMGDAPYTLEVSSRGVSTPLTEPKHFRRNITRLVKATVAEDGVTQEVLGRILAADEASVTLEVEAPGSKPHKPLTTERTVPLDRIRRAVVQVELNRPTETEEN
ncbi:ribosome maturation factor RimP [Acidipropionibacterium timonense]|uniref:ribosome maturation factor RimP n=1 Tax=Acidipropionibacterium timonense TaxID=2161818 RepID=UPI00103106AF|nr:ribosome maturation factor RimP [Acidipropionibacterium timonense]